MKLLLAGNGLLLAGTITGWDNFELSRWNQAYRDAAGEAMRGAADQLLSGSNAGGGSGRWSDFAKLSFRVDRELERQERSELGRSLRIIADQISNNANTAGAAGGLHWRLELEPAAKPADDEAA